MRDRLHKINRTLAGAAISFFFIALVILLYVTNNPVFQHLDSITYNALITAKTRPADSRIAIIDIDEKSLAKLGQWPWPRYLLADVVQKLTDSGALAIGLDMLLDSPDRNSPELIQKQLNDRFGAKLNLSSIPKELLNYDRHFQEVIANSPVVLGMAAQFKGTLPESYPLGIGVAEKKLDQAHSPKETISKGKSAIFPLPIFSDVAPVGTINANMGESGFLDKVPLLFNIDGNVYASLALRTLMRAMGKKSLRLQGDKDGLSEIGVSSQISIPVEPNGVFRIVFRGKAKSYPYYSVADLLENKIDPALLSGRVLFLGTSAIGLVDIKATPFDPYFPGVEAHATLVDNFLNQESIRELPFTKGLQVLGIVIIGVITMFVFWRFGAMVYVPIAIFLLGLILWTSYYAFQKGIFLSPVYTILSIFMMAIHILPIRFTIAEMKRRQIKQVFSRYVAAEVVSRLADSQEPLAGVQKEVTVLFTDILGFTTISEQLSPTQIVSLLNQYFTPMTECVKKNEGTLDKYIGDALMAFWNAPLEVTEHASKAIKAAIEMQEQLARLRPIFKERFGVELKMGIGIHTGLAHVGNMGSEDLQDYTCVGDTVNLASRLEGLCRRYGVGIVVSADAVGSCEGLLHFRRLDTIRVKGKVRPSTIFTPISTNTIYDIEKERDWNEALDMYGYGHFAKAKILFEQLIEKQPEYQALTQVYIKRCQSLIDNPPEKWQGAWNYDEK